MQSTDQNHAQRKLRNDLRDRVLEIVEGERRKGTRVGVRIGAAGVLFLFGVIGMGLGSWILGQDLNPDA